MKAKFTLFVRSGVYYAQDTDTGKQTSLRTKDEGEAIVILNARNEAHRQPVLNLQIARAYLTASDPALSQRTWQDVMNQIETQGRDSSQTRYVRAMKSKAFDPLRKVKLLETKAEDFLAVLRGGQVSVVHFLKRIHNLAVSLGWLPMPVLAPRLWPKLSFKSKRGITLEEHRRILAAEMNPERNLFYQMLWEIGASQSDAAMLAADNIDWQTNTLTYFRMKTGEQAQMTISRSLSAILRQLPASGVLFPKISASKVNARAAEFNRRCRLLDLKGVTLHSYRYAWAERAKVVGMPERFAQAALGHNSKAIHRAYAKKALVVVPALEDYEQKIVAMPAAVAV